MRYLIYILFIVCGNCFAQQKTITGTVIDADGMPLPGVSITVKGDAKTLTTSAIDGTYSIVAGLGDQLNFEYLDAKEIRAVEEKNSIDVQIVENEEVVIVQNYRRVTPVIERTTYQLSRFEQDSIINAAFFNQTVQAAVQNKFTDLNRFIEAATWVEAMSVISNPDIKNETCKQLLIKKIKSDWKLENERCSRCFRCGTMGVAYKYVVDKKLAIEDFKANYVYFSGLLYNIDGVCLHIKSDDDVPQLIKAIERLKRFSIIAADQNSFCGIGVPSLGVITISSKH